MHSFESLGDHSICIFDNRAKNHFGAICRKINDSISAGHAVIYIAKGEPLKILAKMKRHGIIEGVEDNIQIGALNLMNIATIFPEATETMSGEATDAEVAAAHLLQKWKNVIYKTKQQGDNRRRKKYKGILIVADDISIFATTKNFGILLLFEQKIRQNAREKNWLEVICCYNKKIIDEMPIRHLVPLLKSHSHNLLGRDWIERRIDDYRILSIMEKGIDDIVGKNSGRLFFHTLRLVYGIDEDKIIQRPELLEEKLQKLFGKSGNAVLQSVGNRLRNEIYEGC